MKPGEILLDQAGDLELVQAQDGTLLMAKIVEPPKPRRGKCGECRATVEYLPEEVKTRRWTDHGGGGNMEEYVPCPREKCKGEVHVSGDNS